MEIGFGNARHIKSLTMGLPHPVKTMPTKYIKRYTYMFEQHMPGLSTLKITTKFGRWFVPVMIHPYNIWIETNAGLLWFAAWITRSNDRLRYALWDEKNSVSGNRLDDARLPDWDERPLVELSVTLTKKKPEGIQVTRDPNEIMAENDELPEDPTDSEEDDIGEPGFEWVSNAGSVASDGDVVTDLMDGMSITSAEEDIIANLAQGASESQRQPIFPATRILLDAYAIRRKGRAVLLTDRDVCRPYPYQLSPESNGSEAKKPTLQEMSDDVLAEELFLHNKLPNQTLNEHSHLLNIDIAYLKARKQERKCEAEEMLVKNGPEIVQPVVEDAVGGWDVNDDNDNDAVWGLAGNGGFGDNDNDDHDDTEDTGDSEFDYAIRSDYEYPSDDGCDSDYSFRNTAPPSQDDNESFVSATSEPRDEEVIVHGSHGFEVQQDGGTNHGVNVAAQDPPTEDWAQEAAVTEGDWSAEGRDAVSSSW